MQDSGDRLRRVKHYTFSTQVTHGVKGIRKDKGEAKIKNKRHKKRLGIRILEYYTFDDGDGELQTVHFQFTLVQTLLNLTQGCMLDGKHFFPQ